MIEYIRPTVVSVWSAMVSRFCLRPTFKRWFFKINPSDHEHMIHLMPYVGTNLCRLDIHLACTYFVDPSSVVWSELGPVLPSPPMRVLEVWRSGALKSCVWRMWPSNSKTIQNIQVAGVLQIITLLQIPIASKDHQMRSETTLNYWMMVERYPNLKEEVGGSISGCEISSLFDKELAKWSTASYALALAYRSSVSNKKRKRKKPPNRFQYLQIIRNQL